MIPTRGNRFWEKIMVKRKDRGCPQAPATGELALIRQG